MNWDKIKEKCPKAFQYMLYKKGWRWQGNDYATGVCYSGVIDSFIYDRVLYDFFDEQGIYGGVDKMWGYWIQTEDDENGDYEFYENIVGERRSVTEEKMFEKEFEILEQKL